MKKRCLFLGDKNDALFRQIVSDLLTSTAGHLDMFESDTNTVSELLNEISRIDPDVILLEEMSPSSMNSLLPHVLLAKPGRPVIVISQEHNWVHMVRWETMQLQSASDLINTIALV